MYIAVTKHRFGNDRKDCVGKYPAGSRDTLGTLDGDAAVHTVGERLATEDTEVVRRRGRGHWSLAAVGVWGEGGRPGTQTRGEAVGRDGTGGGEGMMS